MDFLLREAMFAAGSAASLAALLIWLGPPGNDLAAHVYQRTVFLHDGFQLWNNFWYGGRYSFVTYSVLYYPLAALFGISRQASVSPFLPRNVRASSGPGSPRFMRRISPSSAVGSAMFLPPSA